MKSFLLPYPTISLVDQYSEAVTHVVMKSNNGKGKRTVNYLMAVISGCWVLDFQCKFLSSFSLILTKTYYKGLLIVRKRRIL